MSDHLPFSHRGFVLTIRSHEAPQGGWIADVAIERMVDDKVDSHTVTWDPDHPLATRDAAIAGAKQQAIEWVDARFTPTGN